MSRGRRLPDWAVDPAEPAVPDLAPEAGEYEPPGPGLDTAAHGALDEAHTLRTRYTIALRRCRRLAALASAPSAPPAPARRKGGHPGHRARNDRLLALYEATPERLPRLQRCRRAAAALARETAEAAGRPPVREHVKPPATARDAIAEARHRRDELAAPAFSTDELFGAD